MPRKSLTPKKTSKGKPVPRSANRVAFAEKHLCSSTYSATRTAIMETFQVSKATAERDIAEAQKQIAEDAEAERPYLRARETSRLTRIAEKAEEAEEFQAAVAASRGISKINGLEVQVLNLGATSPEQQAMLGALVMTPHQRQQRIAQLRAEHQKAREAAAKPAADADAVE